MSGDDGLSRGVLYAKKSQQNYTLQRLIPAEPLSIFVDTFWCVKWELASGQEHLQQNIPDPCIHIVFEAGKSRVVGAVTKRYSVELSDSGQIFGVKFRPGGFFALTGVSAHKLSDTSVDIRDELVLGACVMPRPDLIQRVLDADDIKSKAMQCEAWLQPLVTKHGRNPEAVISINNIVNLVNQDSSIVQVEHLASATNLSVRTLQRLFKREVGVSPKWLIRKYRMQEVLSRLEAGQRDWQEVMANIGYFDQAHFIRDFKELTGVTPTQYIKGLA